MIQYWTGYFSKIEFLMTKKTSKQKQLFKKKEELKKTYINIIIPNSIDKCIYHILNSHSLGRAEMGKPLYPLQNIYPLY